MTDEEWVDRNGAFAMIEKSILMIGAIAAIGATMLTAPARAEGIGHFAGIGVGLGLDVGGSDRETVRSVPAGATVRWVGAPGWQRGRNGRVYGWPGTRVAVRDLGFPDPGPNRHTVCGWQDRYDRHERWIGSRRICWVEAR
jgi:hypothetical protein